ncbi:polysaccharide lyase family 26 protein [Aspergillus undulatus]|uniref:polysaccharide lyase family 26 protein n=1 Tax=Aspergillus undulatus TaxID=1810928 RepID=UPI003CCCFEA6
MLPSLQLVLGVLPLIPGALSMPGSSTSNLNTRSTSDSIPVTWLGSTPSYTAGTTFGLPWPKGKYTFNNTAFSIAGVPLQSWVNGYWADGSIKWTGHAIPSIEDSVEDGYTVDVTSGAGAGAGYARRAGSNSNSTGVKVTESREGVTINTGKITVSFPKSGSSLVGEITTSSGQIVGTDGKLVLHTQSGVAEDVASRSNASITYSNFESKIDNVTVSKENSVRALVTVTGTHAPTGETTHDAWLRFVVRFYLYANSDAVRIVHSIVFDGDAESDFISGLGIRFSVPLEGEELYNRHVRIPGEEGGFLHEAVKGITGLRRDPGEEVRSAQVAGKVLPSEDTWDTRVTTRLHWIPNWNDYKLSQLSPDGFTIAKRTQPGQGWIHIPGGTRSHGLTYLGGATKGGLALGLRDFWKRFPTGVEISNAAGDVGSVTVWLYSPDAQPLDLRPFHDGLGQETYEEQLDALEITYEDYEPGFNTPYGIARTSEVYLYAFDSTPESDYLAALSDHTNNPPVLIPGPEYIHETNALGSYWNLPAGSNTNNKAATIESHLEFLVSYYEDQVSSRKWYGFLDYGDYMHTYDEDRHIWRYDVGGYAWDNSELSPDLFLWQQFLRTGREDVYRLAEALTRHTGEVDVYHIGDWKGLGTRHGVQHWADSAKQVRITQPQYRKYFYYLSGGDERVGELLEEALDTDKTYEVLDPNRKVREDGWTPTPGQPATISLGTDWAGLAGGWLIEWERRGPRWQEARYKLTNTARGIANLTNGFVTGSGLYSTTNGSLTPPPADLNNAGLVSVSHLNAVFGLPEVVDELLTYWGNDAPDRFRDAWLDYTYYYSATAEEQESRYGESFGNLNLIQGHSRLTAYWARENDNGTIAERAWDEFYNNNDGFTADEEWAPVEVNGSSVLVPVQEATFVSTNAFAQYGLAAIQNLALVGDALEGSPYP